MQLFFSQSAQVLDPLAAQFLIQTQDLGVDQAGSTLAVAVKGQEVKPLKHGTVSEEQFQKVLNAGYDLLMLVADPQSDQGVVITESALIISDRQRYTKAKEEMYKGNPQVLERLEDLCKAAFV